MHGYKVQTLTLPEIEGKNDAALANRSQTWPARRILFTKKVSPSLKEDLGEKGKKSDASTYKITSKQKVKIKNIKPSEIGTQLEYRKPEVRKVRKHKKVIYSLQWFFWI